MSAAFISDLHLDTESGVQMLRDALSSAIDSDTRDLFILGDLFEAWIGDDDDSPLAQAVVETFVPLRERGVQIHFLPGNRDFLLGTGYLQRFGGQLLEEPIVVDVCGRRVLLVHGDHECLADVQYQQLRTQWRNPDWQRGFLARSLTERRQFAAHARQQSKQHTGQLPTMLMDADADRLLQLLDQHRACAVIHGHTHRPAIHALHAAGRPALRVVLGAWHHVPSWLHADHNGLLLHAEGLQLRSDWPAE